MSGTSVKIFGNDMAQDVKTDFCELYGIGKSVDEINEYILEYKPDDEDEDACAFWSALALVEWEYGVLTEDIKNKTEYIIKNKSDENLFNKEKDAEARKRELEKLINTINTVNLTPKKRKKTYVYRTSWKVGDVLALPLYGKYVYFHVCGVERDSRKIEELEQDSVYVKVFDIVSEQLLAIKAFRPKIFHKLKYKKLDIHRDCFVKSLWSVGIKEQNDLESKMIYIGTLPTKYETTKSVYADFQFQRVENTLIELFNL